MNAEGRKRRKTFSAVTAVIVAIAILVTGTFAWQSISQAALNEKTGDVNPGGRLHDDFNGTNKDVYVENFASPGSDPIFARIRLDEYMELGTDAGTNKDAEDRKAASLVAGADINDKSTWKTHIPGDADDPFHAYWSWTTGGSTIFMPTFNKNKDSLAADINGTYEGTTAGDDTHYDDYVTYTDGETKTADAVYDADDNAVDEGSEAVEGENIRTTEETHTAKATQTAKVLTMKEWKDMGSPVGKFWVYDTDGWAYWAEAIQPGEATGLLLDGISMDGVTDENWYYAINVVGQFVTADDIGSAEAKTGLFGENAGAAPTADALALLNKAAKSKATTLEDGTKIQDNGDNTYQPVKEDGSLGDPVYVGKDGIPGTDDDEEVVVLSPADPTYGDKFLGPKEDGSYAAAGEDGKLGTDDDIQVWGNPTLEEGIVTECPVDTVTVTADADSVRPGNTLQLSAKVTGNGNDAANQKVDWAVSGSNSEDTKINEEGLLSVGADETATAITVTAASQQKDSVSGTKTINIIQASKITVSAAGNATEVVKGSTLQFSVNVEGDNLGAEDQGVTWSVSGDNAARSASATSISKDGLLTVGEDETAVKLTVKATLDWNDEVAGTYEVTVKDLVDTVAVSSDTDRVRTGDTLQMNAEVTGNNKPAADQSVTWAISGNNSADTKINENGLLTIGADETASTVTVTATSKQNAQMSGTKDIQIVRITAIGVNQAENQVNLVKGSQYQFTANVTGENLTDDDKAVTWSVSGGEGVTLSEGTTIDENGLLTIAEDETATTLTITAASKWSTVSGMYPPVTLKELVDTVTVSSTTDRVRTSNTLQFSAEVTGSGTPAPNQSVDWSVSGNSSADTKISKDGLLTVAADEASYSITVKATSKQNPEVSGTKKIKVTSLSSISVKSEDGIMSVFKGATMKFSPAFGGSNLTADEKAVTWSLSGNNSADTTISEDGLLNVAADETANALTVSVASKWKPDIQGFAVIVVKVPADAELSSTIESITPGSTDTVTIDGVEFYVLDKQNDQALLLSKDILEERSFSPSTNVWKYSDIRTYLNDTWINKYPTLKQVAVPTSVNTISQFDNFKPLTTIDEVFLLSELDVFGTINRQEAEVDSSLYTAGRKLDAPGGSWIAQYNGEDTSWMLRSPCLDAGDEAVVFKTGGSVVTSNKNSSGIRPALWVKLSSLE